MSARAEQAGGTAPLRIALAQINPTVGDIAGNAVLIADGIDAARRAGARIVAFPELAICGYPPEDLLLKRHFLDVAAEAVVGLAAATNEIVALVGFPERAGESVYNAVAVLADGEHAGSARKILLPNYGVFDEGRYFTAGTEPALIELDGIRVSVTICEDVWFPGGPAALAAREDARLVINSSGSPYHRGKGSERERMIADRARETGAAFALCNTIGGQDELVFDGHSVIVDGAGTTLARAGQFEPELLVCDLPLEKASGQGEEADLHPALAPAEAGTRLIASIGIGPGGGPDPARRLADPLEDCPEVYAALRLGLADYARKNRFEGAVVALSGGIDSALVALLAVDALGADAVTLVSMPSPYSSAGTREDARRIAANLGTDFLELPITEAMDAFAEVLSEPFSRGGVEGVAEENIQSRIRGTIMMALSNRFGSLVLATGNKSEYSVGYATLYGDMAGGFAVIKDVPKLLVYELVRHRNALAGEELIPASVIERAPSAELRPDQKDLDSLPPYELLDRILEAYVEEDLSAAEIEALGIDRATVDRVVALVDRAEYKRRQAPPGVKITPKAFGRDRRLPITNRFRG